MNYDDIYTMEFVKSEERTRYEQKKQFARLILESFRAGREDFKREIRRDLNGLDAIDKTKYINTRFKKKISKY